MQTKKRGLGRGLDALLGSAAPIEAQPGDELRELPLDALSAGRHQPRRRFDAEALEGLAESIRAQGVVQPIVVRPQPDGGSGYEIIAGERRWRAARMAGLKLIPAVVRQMPDRTAMAVALVENIQRADLNPLEEAEALRRLIDECGLTHEQTASAVGRSRAAVSNLLRLLDLHPEVQALVREHRISLGHAKVLMALQGERQLELALEVAEKQLSVRETERLVQKQPAEPAAAAEDPATRTLSSELTAELGLAVRVTRNPRGVGRVTIGYRDAAQLEQILSRLRRN